MSSRGRMNARVELAPTVPIKQVLSPKGRPSTNILRQPFSIGGCFVSTNLPAANAKKEANDVALLLLLKLFEVFEGTHFDSANTKLSSVSRWLQKRRRTKGATELQLLRKESKAGSTGRKLIRARTYQTSRLIPALVKSTERSPAESSKISRNWVL